MFYPNGIQFFTAKIANGKKYLQQLSFRREVILFIFTIKKTSNKKSGQHLGSPRDWQLRINPTQLIY